MVFSSDYPYPLPGMGPRSSRGLTKDQKRAGRAWFEKATGRRVGYDQMDSPFLFQFGSTDQPWAGDNAIRNSMMNTPGFINYMSPAALNKYGPPGSYAGPNTYGGVLGALQAPQYRAYDPTGGS